LARARLWLAEIRMRQGLSHSEVAKKAKINRSFYTQIENGTRNPSVMTAQKIAKALGFDWTLFFEPVSCVSPQNQKQRKGA